MTDTELLDGLQMLHARYVLVVRSCRSGVKIELSLGDGQSLPYREFFGAPLDDAERKLIDPGNRLKGDPWGSDIRVAIRRAIEAEHVSPMVSP